jgi:hypothetical protein
VTRLYAARVAARHRRELNADVDMIRGRYGVFKVVVDGDTVIDGGGAACWVSCHRKRRSWGR